MEPFWKRTKRISSYDRRRVGKLSRKEICLPLVADCATVFWQFSMMAELVEAQTVISSLLWRVTMSEICTCRTNGRGGNEPVNIGAALVKTLRIKSVCFKSVCYDIKLDRLNDDDLRREELVVVSCLEYIKTRCVFVHIWNFLWSCDEKPH